jgi:FMN-dependent NADH-azoreductase
MDLSMFYSKPAASSGKRLLHIDSSPRIHGSHTRVLSGEFVQTWKAAHPNDTVDYLDLIADPAPHVNEAVAHLLHTGSTPKGELARADIEAIELTEALVNRFTAADLYVLGVPMYYAHVPSTLKAYMDHLPYFGRTVTLTPEGPRGLLEGKQAVVISARGFDYSPGSPIASYDLLEPWLRNAFAFIGITEVTFINLDGLDFGEEAVARAVSRARAAIKEVVAHGVGQPRASGMSISAMKAMVEKFCRDFSDGNVEGVLAAMAETATWRVMGSFPLAGARDRQEFGRSIANMRSSIPEGVRMTPGSMTAEGDRVAVEAEAFGKLTNGKIYHSPLHLLVEIRDGKIQAVREYMDTYHVYEVFHG